MPTIICEEKKLAFLHIPKNAGTSIGRQLRDKLVYDQRFSKGVTHHPVLGQLYNDHLTLSQIELIHPDAMEKILNYNSFAILRNPIDRFQSALGQYLRNTKGVSLAEVSALELENVVDEIIKALSAGVKLDRSLTFFIPQSEYLFLRNEPVVKNIFLMEDLSDLLKFLLEGYGLEIDTSTVERSAGDFAWKQRFEAVGGNFLRPILRPLIPRAALQEIKSRQVEKLKKATDEKVKYVLSDEKRKSFLERFYCHDFDLFEKLNSPV